MSNLPAIVPPPPTEEVDQFAALSPQERAFAFAYLESFDYRDAAKQVGLSPDRARFFLGKPLIAAFLRHLEKDQQPYMVLNRAFVQAKVLETWEKVNGEVSVPQVDRSGVPFEAPVFHPGPAVQLLTLMSKHAGVGEKVPQRTHISIDVSALGLDTKITVEASEPQSESQDYIDGISFQVPDPSDG